VVDDEENLAPSRADPEAQPVGLERHVRVRGEVDELPDRVRQLVRVDAARRSYAET
jgi:hypothetical protein